MSDNIAAIERRLSGAMKHVILRCSDAGSWDPDRAGWGMGRRWGDLVHGHHGAAFRTVNALEKKGLLYEDEDGAYGLTNLGFAIYIGLRTDAKHALAQHLEQGATAGAVSAGAADHTITAKGVQP